MIEEVYESPVFEQDPNPPAPFSISLIPVEYASESEYQENLVEQEETFTKPKRSIEPTFTPTEPDL